MKYFKIAFLAASTGLTVGLIVFGLFDVDFNNVGSVVNLILRSITIGVIVGVVLGLMNLMFKVGFKKNS